MKPASLLPIWTIAAPCAGWLLLASLGAVVLLAKAISPFVESAVARVGAPNAVVGVIIATTVLQGAVHLVIFAVYLFTTVVP